MGGERGHSNGNGIIVVVIGGGRSRLAEFDKYRVDRVERGVDLFADLSGQRRDEVSIHVLIRS